MAQPSIHSFSIYLFIFDFTLAFVLEETNYSNNAGTKVGSGHKLKFSTLERVVYGFYGANGRVTAAMLSGDT